MRNFFDILGVGYDNILTAKDVLDRIRSLDPELQYVYAIWRSDKPHSEPFYIGKGKGRRIFCHTYRSDRNNRIKKAILEKMRLKGCEPIYSFLAFNVNDAQALSIEAEAIRKVGRIVDATGPLSNMTPGGEGTTETRAKRGAHGMARAVFADGVRFDLLKDAAAALGLYPSTVHKRIAAGIPGYFYEDEGQRPETGIRVYSEEHIRRLHSASKFPIRAVIVHGVRYPNFAAAAAATGLAYHVVRQRCKSGNFPEFKIAD